jgi:hypothetical protein
MDRTENAGRILKCKRRNSRGRETSEPREGFDVGDDPGPAGRIKAGNC